MPSAFEDKLPAELRVKVYEALLTSERPLKAPNGHRRPIDMSILRANKRIHSEAIDVLYNSNTFHAPPLREWCNDCQRRKGGSWPLTRTHKTLEIACLAGVCCEEPITKLILDLTDPTATAPEGFPDAQHVKIRWRDPYLSHDRMAYQSLERLVTTFEANSRAVRFTGVGSFDVVNTASPSHRSVSFECEMIVLYWKGLASMSRDQLRESEESCDGEKVMEAIGEVLEEYYAAKASTLGPAEAVKSWAESEHDEQGLRRVTLRLFSAGIHSQ